MFIKVKAVDNGDELIINTDHILRVYTYNDYSAIEYINGDMDIVDHLAEELSQILLCQDV